MSNASLELGGDNWAAKDGNLLGYAVGDSSGKYVPREFTFTRGSNLAATRIAANGLIEKGRENLLLQSNQFDTTWTTTSSITLTSGQSGYDGSSDAWLLERTSTGGQRVAQTKSSSGVQTYSVYAKANVGDWLYMRCNTSGSPVEAYFDLANGVLGAYGSTTRIDAKIQAVGNGWYRCSMAFNSIIVEARLYPVDGNGSVGGTNESIYIQDAQLEQGLVATDYIETGASTVQAGLLEDEPRIDYTGGTGSLLLEPSRTQIVRQSEYIDGYSTKVQCTTTPNYGTSPEGLVNSTRLEFTANGYIHEGVSQVSGTEYTISVYAKRNDSGTESFGFFVDGSGTIDSAITLTSEWKRFDYTYTASNSSKFGFAGNSGADVSVFGIQLEEASYPTSYIPNHSGGSVTRGADDLNDLDVSSMLTSSSFTWFLDLNDYIGSDINSQNIWLESTSSSIEIQFRVRPDGYRVYYSGIAGGSTYPIVGSTTANKFCVSYDGNDYRLYVDGTLERTITSVGDSGWDIIRNQMSDASLPLKQMLLFPTALSDAQCSALTVEGLKEEILTSYIAAVDTLEDGAEARLDTYLQNLEELIV